MTKYIDFALVGELVVHGDVHYEDLLRIPAADVTEVQHGKWIELLPFKNVYICSLCDQWGEYHWNYCPNCGAKMKGNIE